MLSKKQVGEKHEDYSFYAANKLCARKALEGFESRHGNLDPDKSRGLGYSWR